MIATTLDRVVIGFMLGAKYVAYYATQQNLVTRLNLLPSAMLRTLFPRFSASASDHADELSHHALAFLNCAFTLCVVVALFALAPFLNVWLGHEMAGAVGTCRTHPCNWRVACRAVEHHRSADSGQGQSCADPRGSAGLVCRSSHLCCG